MTERPKIELREQVEVCPGAYDLHLYCKWSNPEHEFDEFPHQPTEVQTYGEAVAKARSWGWVIHRDQTGTCPKCARWLFPRPTA